MTTFYSSAPFSNGGCEQCAPSLLQFHPEAVVWNAPPPIEGLVPENVALSIQNGGWTPRSVMELCALIFVASNGGVWISPEVYVLANLDPISQAIPFVGAIRGSVLNPYIFGMEKGSPCSVAALRIVQDLLISEVSALKDAEKDGCVVVAVMEQLASQKLVSVLPTSAFSLFGVQKFALDFTRLNAEKRNITLERMSGRFEGQPPFGVYTGKQGLILHYRLKVDDEIRVPAGVITPPANPEIEATPGQMAASLMNSAIEAGKNIAAGRRVIAKPEEIIRRKTICSGDDKDTPKCEFFNADKGRCSKCGCWTRFKVRLESEKCPEGKW